MSIHELLQSKRKKILQIAARHGAHKVRVFGSVARGTARRGSDIDFLVEMEEGRVFSTMPPWFAIWNACSNARSMWPQNADSASRFGKKS